MPSCSQHQRSLPENKNIVADMPFALDAYCSCSCARLAMRMSIQDLQVGANLALLGTLAKDPTYKKLAESNAAICIKALTANE